MILPANQILGFWSAAAKNHDIHGYANHHGLHGNNGEVGRIRIRKACEAKLHFLVIVDKEQKSKTLTTIEQTHPQGLGMAQRCPRICGLELALLQTRHHFLAAPISRHAGCPPSSFNSRPAARRRRIGATSTATSQWNGSTRHAAARPPGAGRYVIVLHARVSYSQNRPCPDAYGVTVPADWAILIYPIASADAARLPCLARSASLGVLPRACAQTSARSGGTPGPAWALADRRRPAAGMAPDPDPTR
jgi:hypothetical protein